MSSLRVAQVIRSAAMAGVESHVAALSGQLALMGAEVAVVGGDPEETRRRLSDRVRWLPGASSPQLTRSLCRLGRLDVVHAHMTAAELVAVLTRRRTSAAVVATRHFAAARGSNPLSRAASGFITRRVDAQIAVSRYVADHVEGPTEIIFGGVADIADDAGSLSNAAPEPAIKVVLVAQRLEPEKCTATAVAAWAQSDLAQKGWQLWLAGEGSERPALEELSGRLGVSGSCRFLGFVSDMDPLMRASAMLLSPADGEPFGLSVVEAMARGLPVVAARSGAHLETVGLATGARLYDPGDTGACAHALTGLASSAVDRRAYGAELREIQRERFSLPRMASEVLDLYDRVVGRS